MHMFETLVDNLSACLCALGTVDKVMQYINYILFVSAS